MAKGRINSLTDAVTTAIKSDVDRFTTSDIPRELFMSMAEAAIAAVRAHDLQVEGNVPYANPSREIPAYWCNKCMAEDNEHFRNLQYGPFTLEEFQQHLIDVHNITAHLKDSQNDPPEQWRIDNDTQYGSTEGLSDAEVVGLLKMQADGVAEPDPPTDHPGTDTLGWNAALAARTQVGWRTDDGRLMGMDDLWFGGERIAVFVEAVPGTSEGETQG